MNRLVVALLAVLIVLVAGHGYLVWRADEHAQDAADKQACLQGAQATAIIALVAPALVAPSEDAEQREAQLVAIQALGTQADAC